jgi:large subunit ribosomal protein L17
MRHKKSGRKLKRTSSHRKATLNALCTALLRHKKIKTTIAKAKETRMVVEKIITRAKNAVATEGESKNVHARRQVARYINDRDVVKELFAEIAPKVASRAGGYTRVVKLGQRSGDGAEVAILELVDFQAGEASKASSKQEKSQKSAKKKQQKKSASAQAETGK